MNKRVVITGLGIISPLGNNLENTWSAITTGKSGVGPITLFDATENLTQFGAEVKDFDPVELFGSREARRMDRFSQLAMAAAEQAVAHSGLDVNDDNRHRVGVIIGTGIGGVSTLMEQALRMIEHGPRRVSPHLVPMMLPDTAAGKVAIAFGLRGPNMAVSTACASGNNAIGEATEAIRRGAADAMVTGGAEAGIVQIAMAGFNTMGALSTRNDNPQGASRPFDADRDGFVAGEGSGILVLESMEHAEARGATIHGEILGYGASADAYHVTAPLETGEGAILAMKTALAQAGLEPRQIGYINAHGTSTQLNDKSETAAIKAVFGEMAYDVPISSTKSMTGHLLGAAGAVEAIFSTKAIVEGILPPTINYTTPDPECDLDYVPNEARKVEVDTVLSNSFGFGGHNACLVIGRYVNGKSK